MSGLPEVIRATVRGVPDVVTFQIGTFDDAWATIQRVGGTQLHGRSVVTDRRPLVLIDPDDAEQVSALLKAYGDQYTAWTPDAHGPNVDRLQAALRALAEPTPPEPQGLGAVVRDAEGETWVRKGTIEDGGEWTKQIHLAFTSKPWAKLPQPVTVLTEGWSE